MVLVATSNCSPSASIICCRSMAWPMSATSRRTAKWRLKQTGTVGGTVRTPSAGAGAAHPAGGRRVDGRHRRAWRDRGHRMRPHVHGHAWRQEGAVPYRHLGGARMHARRGHADRGDEPDSVEPFVSALYRAESDRTERKNGMNEGRKPMAIDMKAIHDSQSTLVMGVLNITEIPSPTAVSGLLRRRPKPMARR